MAGESLSLQYHEVKDETIYVQSGELLLHLNGQDILMKPGDSMRIKPLDKHRMSAMTTCEILEVSTPELDDVIRLKDLYGRVTN